MCMVSLRILDATDRLNSHVCSCLQSNSCQNDGPNSKVQHDRVVLDARLLKKLDILVLSGKRYLMCEMTSGDGVQLRQAFVQLVM